MVSSHGPVRLRELPPHQFPFSDPIRSALPKYMRKTLPPFPPLVNGFPPPFPTGVIKDFSSPFLPLTSGISRSCQPVCIFEFFIVRSAFSDTFGWPVQAFPVISSIGNPLSPREMCLLSFRSLRLYCPLSVVIIPSPAPGLRGNMGTFASDFLGGFISPGLGNCDFP